MPIEQTKLGLVQAFPTHMADRETEVTQISETEYSLKTSFKRRGQYDLHVVYSGDVIVTYVVYVQRNAE
jgi:hypothetical protein